MKKKEEKKAIKKHLTEVSQGEQKKSAKKSRSKKHVKMTTLSSRIIGDKNFMSKVKESSDNLLNDINAVAKKIAPYIKGIVKDSDKEVISYVERLCGDIPADYNAHRDIFDSFVGLVKMMILDDMYRLQSGSPVPEDSAPCSNEEIIPVESDKPADSRVDELKELYIHTYQRHVRELDIGSVSVGYASKDKLSDLLVSWGYGRFSNNFERMYNDIIDKYMHIENGALAKFDKEWFDFTAKDWSEYLKSYIDKILPDIINGLADDNFGFKTKVTKGLIHVFLMDEITDGSYVLALNGLSDHSFGSGALGFQVAYLRMILQLVVNWILWHPVYMMFFVAHRHGTKHVFFDASGEIKKLEYEKELDDLRKLSNFWGIAVVTSSHAFNTNSDHDNTHTKANEPYYQHMKCSERLINNVEFVSMMNEHGISSVISKTSSLASEIDFLDTMKVVTDALNVTEENIQAILLRFADIITEFVIGDNELKGYASIIHSFIIGSIDACELTHKLTIVYVGYNHRDIRDIDMRFKVNDIMHSIYLWFDKEFYGTSRVTMYLKDVCEKEINKK